MWDEKNIKPERESGEVYYIKRLDKDGNIVGATGYLTNSVVGTIKEDYRQNEIVNTVFITSEEFARIMGTNKM